MDIILINYHLYILKQRLFRTPHWRISVSLTGETKLYPISSWQYHNASDVSASDQLPLGGAEPLSHSRLQVGQPGHQSDDRPS